MLFIRTYNACKTFPALDPLTIRKTKAKEIFLLFRRIDTLNDNIKTVEKKQKHTKPKEEMIDCTGKDTGWF